LEGIVIPLARELVQNKKAILIDPINNRLRTIVMPTSLAGQSSVKPLIEGSSTDWQNLMARPL